LTALTLPGWDKYKWEKTLKDGEIAHHISEELIRESMQPDRMGFDDKLKAQAKRTGNPHKLHDKFIDIVRKEFSPTPTVPDRPAIAVLPRKPKPKKPVKPKIQKISDVRPIAFESEKNSFGNFADPYHSRKVTMYIKVKALQLPSAVRKRLISLAEHKDMYRHEKDMLVIKSQKKRTQSYNKQYVIKLFRALLAEAWRVDLNYLPGIDNLEPHQIVEKEINERKAQELDARTNSFERIKESQNWTIFSLRDPSICR